MSKTVDKKVVEMSFDNRNFEKNVKTSLSTIDKLKSSLNFSGMTKGLDELSASANRVNFSPLTKGIEQVELQFNSLYSIADQTMRRITNSVMDFGLDLGKKLIIDPKKSGFEEYELKMGSVQTIMASTGESLEKVNEYLEELNTYSDKTIYSFQDMTSNIGKFTNAGVSLEDAVHAIKGISNEAALAGANANEASHAMYNFAQALSSGSVKLTDWKSIEIANMATKDFKNELIKTAVEIGTLTDAGDNMYKTLKGKTLNAVHSFNESLQDQWLTTDVLMSTLQKYSDETTDLGKRAKAAAQDVKTFSMLMDTLKEAAQSGWSKTWEILVGDLNESTSLLTKVSITIGGILDKLSNARNDILQAWKAGGGRNAAIDSLYNLYEAIKSLIEPVKSAFKEVFPPLTAELLIKITEEIKKFTSKLILTEKASRQLQDIFKSVFSIIKIILRVLKTGFDIILKYVKILLRFKGNLLDVIHAMSKWIQSITDAIDKSNIFIKVQEGIYNSITKIKKNIVNTLKSIKNSLSNFDIENFIDVLKKLWGFIGFIGGKVVNIASIIAQGITKVFSSGSGTLYALINGTLLGTILGKIKQFVDNFHNTSKEIVGILDGFKKLISGVTDVLKGMQEELEAKKLLKISAAIGILAAALFVISTIPMDDLVKSLSTIAGLFVGLMKALKALSKYTEDFKNAGKSSTLMISMSVSILILSNALKEVASIDTEKLLPAIIALGSIMTLMTRITKKLGNNKNMTEGAGQLILIAVAIKILSGAIKTIGKLNPSQMATGVLGLSSIIILLTAMSDHLNKKKSNMVSASSGIIAMAIGIQIISNSIKTLGLMDPAQMAQGLLGFSAIMIILAGISEYLSRKKSSFSKGGTSMLILSISLAIMAKVAKQFGEMKWGALGKAGAAIGGILLFAFGLSLIGKMGPGILLASTSLLIAGAALAIFIPVIKKLGEMKLKTIGAALLYLAGILAVLGIAAYALVSTGALAAMAALAGVLLLFGAGITLIGVGLVAIAAGLTSLAASLTVSAGAIVAQITIILTGIIMLIPNVIKALADGIILFITTIANSVDKIGDAIVLIISKILEVIVKLIPKIIETLLLLIESFIKSLRDHLPAIVEAGIDIVLALINGLIKKMPDLVQAAFDLITTFINSLADSIRNNAKKIRDAMANLVGAMIDSIFILLGVDEGTSMSKKFYNIGKYIITGLINGIGSGLKKLKEKAETIANTLTKTITTKLHIKSPSKELFKIGEFSMEGFVNGIISYIDKIHDVSNDAGETAKLGILDALGKITDIINSESDIEPTITPVLDLSNIESGATRIGSIFDGQNIGIGANINAISAGLKLQNQNAASNSDIVSAINKLKTTMSEQTPGNTYNLNGISYNDDSPIANAVSDLIKAIEIEGRA